MTVLETARLRIRRFTPDDAPFILALLNEPSFLRFIGDRGVRTLEDARGYIGKGPMDSYERHGFGLCLTERRADGAPIGMCGLLKRETLDDVDIGFAFTPENWGKGYGLEAARATVHYGRQVLGLKRIVAIVSPANEASLGLLGKLGFRFERMIRMAESEPEIQLLGCEL
jgi:RimJ/RimL family protein N-acetyltransferase